MYHRKLAALTLAAALVAAGCSGGSSAIPTSPPDTTTTTTTVAPTTTARPTTTTTTTTIVPEDDVLRMPLTGTPLEDPAEIPNRPALAVKIDNHPRARPQAGFNDADIVFEEVVEGDLTRFAVVFHSGDSDPVGPIRSGRSQDVDMLTPLRNPLFAWTGGNPGVTQLIRGSALVDLDFRRTPGYYRRSGRGGAPHNVYSSTEALWANTPDEFQVPTPILPYLMPDEELEGEPATIASFVMNRIPVRWEYDPEAEVYLRFQGGARHDTEGAGQVDTVNLVVMGVEYRPSQIDARSPEAQTIGVGPVHVFTGGVVRSGLWFREASNEPYRFVFEPDDLDQIDLADLFETLNDADRIGLQPGRTWVELARNDDDFVTWEE
jgi:hypothetical protein